MTFHLIAGFPVMRSHMHFMSWLKLQLTYEGPQLEYAHSVLLISWADVRTMTALHLMMELWYAPMDHLCFTCSPSQALSCGKFSPPIPQDKARLCPVHTTCKQIDRAAANSQLVCSTVCQYLSQRCSPHDHAPACCTAQSLSIPGAVRLA